MQQKVAVVDIVAIHSLVDTHDGVVGDYCRCANFVAG